MMSNKKIILMTVIFFTLINCKKKTDLNHLGEPVDQADMSDTNISKIVKVDDLQVAFDIRPMSEHEQMMKVMKAKMSHIKGATHGIMVTVMNYQNKKTITNAEIKLKITSPSGVVSSAETEVMSGAGMHHYAVHIIANESGEYKVSAIVNVKGKSHNVKSFFTLQK